MKCFINGKEFDPSCYERECIYHDGRAEGMIIFENPFCDDRQYLMFTGSDYPTYTNWPKPEILAKAQVKKVLKVQEKISNPDRAIAALKMVA